MKLLQFLPVIALFVFCSCGGKNEDPQPVIEHPPFAGDYIGSWEDLGPPGPATFPMSLRIADDYTGQMFYANGAFRPFGAGTEDAKVTMLIDGSAISSFVLDQFIKGYKNDCRNTQTLTGHIEGENELVLDKFTWADCDGVREVLLKFKKKS